MVPCFACFTHPSLNARATHPLAKAPWEHRSIWRSRRSAKHWNIRHDWQRIWMNLSTMHSMDMYRVTGDIILQDIRLKTISLCCLNGSSCSGHWISEILSHYLRLLLHCSLHYFGSYRKTSRPWKMCFHQVRKSSKGFQRVATLEDDYVLTPTGGFQAWKCAAVDLVGSRRCDRQIPSDDLEWNPFVHKVASIGCLGRKKNNI